MNQTKDRVFVGAHVDRAQRDALVELAREGDWSVSAVIRRALAAELQRERKHP